MSKPLVILSALLLSAGAAVGAVMYCGNDASSVAAVFPTRSAPTQLIAPDASHKQSFIWRKTLEDGSVVDDVDMRDGHRKQIDYDNAMLLKQVRSYYALSDPAANGLLEYEKMHNAVGHLENEVHYNKDGSLFMDGRLNGDIYVRRFFFPGQGSDPDKAMVATKATYDTNWNRLTQTDYRLDRTVAAEHAWKDNSVETVTNFAADGKTIVLVEVKELFQYDQSIYYPDGSGPRVQEHNSAAGTTYQFFDHNKNLTLKLVFNNTNYDDVSIAYPGSSAIEWHQIWVEDYSKPAVNGKLPRRLVYVEHVKPNGKLLARYSYDKGRIDRVTVLQTDDPLGVRKEYVVGDDGLARSVETYDEHNNGDKGKPLTAADNVRFDLPSVATEKPVVELPPVPKGFNLYGEPPQMGPH